MKTHSFSKILYKNSTCDKRGKHKKISIKNLRIILKMSIFVIDERGISW